MQYIFNRTANRVDLSAFSPVCLPIDDNESPVGKDGHVYGKEKQFSMNAAIDD